VLAFARRPLPLAVFIRWMPLMVLAGIVVMLTEATEPLGIVVSLHLLLLFWISMVCHGTLAVDRPCAENLTDFYLWLSVGGVLGGLFNGLVAPLAFNAVAEYPLILVLACLLMPGRKDGRETSDEKRGTRNEECPASSFVPRFSSLVSRPSSLVPPA